MLRDIPGAGTTAVTTTSLRPGMTAFAAIAALVTLTVIAFGPVAVLTR